MECGRKLGKVEPRGRVLWYPESVLIVQHKRIGCDQSQRMAGTRFDT